MNETATFPLIGHDQPKARFLEAYGSGRLHHGWIFQGPSGIGKSIFAKRLAGLILGAESDDAPKTDIVMGKILSGSHPDLKWVTLQLNDKGQPKQDISVDQIRELNGFFALRPAMAGWRVGVIDAIDEMNPSGLNALLKTLEEPPENAILFLISHGRTPVLPTIRSRCQVLRLNRLSDEDTNRVLALADADSAFVKSLASGRPGYGIALEAAGAGVAAQAARTLLKSIETKPDPSIIAQALTAAASDAGVLAAYTDTLLEWAADSAEHRPEIARIWLDMHAVRTTAKELNLTPLQTATKLLTVLQDGLKSIAIA
ncbi:MAG: DNA polymerase III subunit delta' [Henriciella sp.]